MQRTTRMNVRKLAKEIYEECKQCKNVGGSINVSRTPGGEYDVYHAYGKTAQAYEGDSAQTAFNRIMYSIQIGEIDWKRPLLKFIEQELRELNEKR